MGLGNTVSGGQLSMPANMLPSIGANGQVVQAAPGAMPTFQQNPAWLNNVMGALTGNPQFTLNAPQMNQSLQGLGGALQGGQAQGQNQGGQGGQGSISAPGQLQALLQLMQQRAWRG